MPNVKQCNAIHCSTMQYITIQISILQVFNCNLVFDELFPDMTSSPENEGARKSFMDEIRFSIEVQGKKGHQNILEVLGCCTIQEPYYLVMPFMKYGDLLGFLRKCSKVKQMHSFLIRHLLFRVFSYH